MDESGIKAIHKRIQYIKDEIERVTVGLKQELAHLESEYTEQLNQWWADKHNLHEGDMVQLLVPLKGEHCEFGDWGFTDDRQFEAGRRYYISFFCDTLSFNLAHDEGWFYDEIQGVTPGQIHKLEDS